MSLFCRDWAAWLTKPYVPLASVLDLSNYLDRNSISQARLSGLEKDLKLTDYEYQTAVALVFPLYIFMQVPSNMMLAWCGRPRLYLGFWVALWGVVSACTGAVHNYHQLAAVRVVLGLTEAPFFPVSVIWQHLNVRRRKVTNHSCASNRALSSC